MLKVYSATIHYIGFAASIRLTNGVNLSPERVVSVSGHMAQIRNRGLSLIGETSARNPLVIHTDIPALQNELKQFGRANETLAKANNRAMNSAIRPSKTVAKRGISRKRNLPPKRVDAKLKVVFSTPDRLVASIRASGQMIPLTDLKGGTGNPKQFSKGVKVTTGVGKRTLIEGAFIARGRAKPGVQVFQRTKIGAGPKREARLPIQQLNLPSIAHTLVDEDISEMVVDRYRGAWVNAFTKQLSAAIRRANKRVRG